MPPDNITTHIYLFDNLIPRYWRLYVHTQVRWTNCTEITSRSARKFVLPSFTLNILMHIWLNWCKQNHKYEQNCLCCCFSVIVGWCVIGRLRSVRYADLYWRKLKAYSLAVTNYFVIIYNKSILFSESVLVDLNGSRLRASSRCVRANECLSTCRHTFSASRRSYSFY